MYSQLLSFVIIATNVLAGPVQRANDTAFTCPPLDPPSIKASPPGPLVTVKNVRVIQCSYGNTSQPQAQCNYNPENYVLFSNTTAACPLSAKGNAVNGCPPVGSLAAVKATLDGTELETVLRCDYGSPGICTYHPHVLDCSATVNIIFGNVTWGTTSCPTCLPGNTPCLGNSNLTHPYTSISTASTAASSA
ncbi:hypothetical protein C8R47DRAFT_1144441 [Mycena vitilis]|nr:hypothetical protein C8R47DRAFT_1144441 [Mycena vitilis]